MKNIAVIFLFVVLAIACENQSVEYVDHEVIANPHAEGFDLEGSDSLAIALADEVMESQGGRKAWDTTRYFSWNFFGRRHLLWDKHQKRARITMQDSSVFLIDLARDTGRIYQNGEVLTQPDSIKKYVEMGKSIWINDSYWLVMPFKLKDSGVTLKYIGRDTTTNGRLAQKLQLTFEGVGRTPQNKYHVYIDDSSKLVTQWDYFSNQTDEEPRISTPWENYKDFNGILLSGGRGGNRALEEIAVFDTLPDNYFTSFNQIQLPPDSK